jgi:hypothetical protein
MRYAPLADMVRAHHNSGWLVAGGLFALATALAAQELPGRGRPIEFSEPRRPVAATNLSEALGDKTSLRKFDDQFKKPFEIFGSGDTPAARLTTPPPARILPPPPSRSLRELLQKRDQWLEPGLEEGEGLGLTPEEMLGVPKYGPDGEPLKRRTQIERYYEDLDRARAAAQAAVTNRAARDALNSGFLGEEEDFKPLNLKLFEEPVNPFAQETRDGNRPSGQKNLFPGFSDLTEPRNAPRDFSEIFGLGGGFPDSPRRQDADSFQSRKQTVEDLLTLRFLNSPAAGENKPPVLGGTPTPMMPNPLTTGANRPAVAPGFGAAGNVGAATGNNFNPGAPLGAGVSSLAAPPTLLGPPQPAWGTPPPMEPSRKLAPAPFEIPKRKF